MIRLVVNWAPLTGDRAKRQQNVWNAIEALMETNDDFVATTVVCPGDSIEDAPRLSGILPRSIGRRNLPYIHDLLDHAYGLAADDDWIGFLNSDVVPTSGFFDRIRSTVKKVVLCNVTDVNRKKKCALRPRYWSIDGVFLEKSEWGRYRKLIPAMVAGAPSWDPAMILWCLKNGIELEWLGESDCLHWVHSISHWRSEAKSDPSALLNRAAFNAMGGRTKLLIWHPKK